MKAAEGRGRVTPGTLENLDSSLGKKRIESLQSGVLKTFS